MKHFLYRNAIKVRSIMLSVALLLSILAVNVFADVNFPVSWRFTENYNIATSKLSNSVSITPEQGHLSNPSGSGHSFIWISFTFDKSVQIAEGSIVTFSFSLSTVGAAPTTIGTNYTRLYPGTLIENSIFFDYPYVYMDSSNTDNYRMRKVSSGETGVVIVCSFPFNTGYLTYTVPFNINKNYSGDSMYLTTLISPIVTGPSFNESLFSAVTDISLKIDENTITQQQGNAIMQRVVDDLEEEYVDHEAVDDLMTDVQAHDQAEAELASKADDILTQPVTINGQTYTLSVDDDIFDTYKSAFSTVLEDWDNFSIAGATVFRRSLTDLFAIFGIFVIFPCTLGLLGALLGRT